MTPTRWWTLGAIALLVAGAVWLRSASEWVDIEVPTLAKNEAARDRFYAAKSLVKRLGGNVVSPRSLDKLPPAAATLFLSSSHWNMFPGRDAALKRWVQSGGRLVFAEMPFFREQFVPAWAPVRNVDDESTAASAAEPSLTTLRPRVERCRVVSEPDSVQPAFGPARSYRVCGFAATRLKSLVAPQWSIGDVAGTRMARVGVGQGSVTVSVLRGAFANKGIVADDGALAFAAALDLRPGDAVWFVDEEARTPFFQALWSAGRPALLLALAALGLALWRGGPRFGPLAVEPGAARRSIGEQIRRTAAFVAAGRGEALHRATLRALDAAATRTIADFATLPTLADRAQAIGQRSGSDPAALASAMRMPKRRQGLGAAIAELERARRSLLPEARAARPDPLTHST
ncbi:MAG: DUF4350 domain-containing protein [Caldimonas sp.]